MAKYGKLLLQRLTFQYCDRMGSSRGMREYIEQHLPALQRSLTHHNPDIQIVTEAKRNRFPLVKAEYAQLQADSAYIERHLQQAANIQRQQQQHTQGRDQQQSKPIRAGVPVSSNVVGVKHQSAEDIKSVVWWLTQSQGRAMTSRVPNKHIRSRRPSIQGEWTPNTFARQ